MLKIIYNQASGYFLNKEVVDEESAYIYYIHYVEMMDILCYLIATNMEVRKSVGKEAFTEVQHSPELFYSYYQSLSKLDVLVELLMARYPKDPKLNQDFKHRKGKISSINTRQIFQIIQLKNESVLIIDCRNERDEFIGLPDIYEKFSVMYISESLILGSNEREEEPLEDFQSLLKSTSLSASPKLYRLSSWDYVVFMSDEDNIIHKLYELITKNNYLMKLKHAPLILDQGFKGWKNFCPQIVMSKEKYFEQFHDDSQAILANLNNCFLLQQITEPIDTNLHYYEPAPRKDQVQQKYLSEELRKLKVKEETPLPADEEYLTPDEEIYTKEEPQFLKHEALPVEKPKIKFRWEFIKGDFLLEQPKTFHLPPVSFDEIFEIEEKSLKKTFKDVESQTEEVETMVSEPDKIIKETKDSEMQTVEIIQKSKSSQNEELNQRFQSWFKFRSKKHDNYQTVYTLNIEYGETGLGIKELFQPIIDKNLTEIMIENRYLQRPWQYDLLDKLIEFFIDSTENFRSILVKYELSERTSEARQQLEFISWIEKKFNNQIVIKLEDMKKFPAMNEYHDRLFWFNNGYRVQIGLGLDLYEAKKYNKRERENPSLKVCKRTFVRYDYKKPD